MKGMLPAALAVASAAMLAALLAGGDAAGAAFGLLAAAFPVGLIALALVRRRRLGRNALALAVLAVLLVGSTAAMLALRGGGVDGPRLAGLPLSLAVLLGGIWLVPLLLTGLAHALTFDAGPSAPAPPAPGRAGAGRRAPWAAGPPAEPAPERPAAGRRAPPQARLPDR